MICVLELSELTAFEMSHFPRNRAAGGWGNGNLLLQELQAVHERICSQHWGAVLRDNSVLIYRVTGAPSLGLESQNH